MPHAIQIRQTGGPEVLNWTAVDVGEPGSGQVRLRQAAARDALEASASELFEVVAWVRCALTSINALRSRMPLRPTRLWKRAQPRAPPS